MEDTSFPARLYRYRAINNWLEPLLLRNELYFSTLAELNDPCEGKFDVYFPSDDDSLRSFLHATLREDAILGKVLTIVSRDPALSLQDASPDVIVETIIHRRHLKTPEGQHALRSYLERRVQSVGVCCFAEQGDSNGKMWC